MHPSKSRSPYRPLTLVVSAIQAFVVTGSAMAEVRFVDVAEIVGLDFTPSGNSAFAAITNPMFRTMFNNMGTGAAVGDYDNDGDLDLYLVGQNEQANRLYRNDHPTKRFTDVTPPVLADTGSGRLAHFVDLDNDGDLDLLLINDDDGENPPTSRSRIFRNDGEGAFTDVSSTSGFRPSGWIKGGAALNDYDGDGLLDIYVTNWGAEFDSGNPNFPGANQLYRNLGNLQFQDVTVAAGLGTLARDSFTAIFADLDDDGDPDLYVAIDHSSDEFYRNDEGHFVLDTTGDVGFTHAGNDMGVAYGDFDGDLDNDLYVTNITDTDGNFGTSQGNMLYENRMVPDNELSVIDATPAAAFNTFWGWGTQFLDADNDGDLDLVAANGFDEWVLAMEGPGSAVYQTPTVLLINDGAGGFSRLDGTGFDAPDDSRGLVAFDYDRDGDLDVLIINREQPVRLFENQSTAQGNWLTVRLWPDSQAIGATIWATTNAGTQRRDVITGQSYLVGTPSELNFGLAGDALVNTLKIEWADGLVETHRNVAANQVVSYERVLVPEPSRLMLRVASLIVLILLHRQRTRRPIAQ